MGESQISIVEYKSDHSGYSCGYCKSEDTNFSRGMHAYTLRAVDYQALIDRGWRRSGYYCYKPTMNKTCCPAYTIKCDALNVKITKSQKKVLKRMNNFLIYGMTKQQKDAPGLAHDGDCGGNGGCLAENLPEAAFKRFESDPQECEKLKNVDMNELVEEIEASSPAPLHTTGFHRADVSLMSFKEFKQTPTPGLGADPNKPRCLKAKQRRLEKRQSKLANRMLVSDEFSAVTACGSSTHSSSRKSCNNQPKSVEDYINQPLPEDAKHRLEVRLVKSEKNISHAEESHAVYQRYQMIVHGETPYRCRLAQYQRFLLLSPLKLRLVRVNCEGALSDIHALFKRYQQSVHGEPDEDCTLDIFRMFLVATPLRPYRTPQGPSCGYGSFHQQYWLDGNKLIAVAVLDILPFCVSSVYFFYDPDYAFLSLGTYSSLRELALVRQLQRDSVALRWYYMGYYIHSCPKMQYKGRYTPSYLLCPETYTWHDIASAVPKLDANKYSRLEEDKTKSDPGVAGIDINQVLLLYDEHPARFRNLSRLHRQHNVEALLYEYCHLVGKQLAYSMLLHYTD